MILIFIDILAMMFFYIRCIEAHIYSVLFFISTTIKTKDDNDDSVYLVDAAILLLKRLLTLLMIFLTKRKTSLKFFNLILYNMINFHKVVHLPLWTLLKTSYLLHRSLYIHPLIANKKEFDSEQQII